MRYIYVFKTSDGIRHTEEMEGESREAVFEALRRRGIRAIKVMAADGGKANGEVRVIGVRRRVAAALVVVAIALTAMVFVWMSGLKGASGDGRGHASARSQPALPLPRQMIPGDRQRIENAPTNLFATAAEAYLARFAEPGRDFGGLVLTNLTDDASLAAMLNAPILIADDELTEHIDLKRITAYIKREMKAYLRGGHTQAEYLVELVNRQRLEMSIRENAEQRIAQLLSNRGSSADAVYLAWLKVNAQLQSMGIYPLPLPDALRSQQQSLDID